MSTSDSHRAITIEKQGAVDWLTLNRPDRLNTLNDDMVKELRDYFIGLANDREVRIVVLQGAGDAFCAGLDLSMDFSEDPGISVMYSMQRSISDIIIHMRHCPQPIVCLLQGPAVGAGFSLATACDIRVASDDVRMNAAFIKVGLTGCDVGVSYHLPRLVGKSAAAEILMTGRYIDAERALQIGLVSKVVAKEALRGEGEAYCKDMLLTSPMALRLTKQCLDMNTDMPSLEAAIALEDRQQAMCSNSADFKEGIAAFLEKRPPEFKEG